MLNFLLKNRFSNLPIFIKKSLYFSLFDGCFAMLHVSLVGGAFLTGFIIYLGASEFQIALITAIPILSQSVQIFSSYIEERIPRRKLIVLLTTFFSRQTCLLLPFIPFVFLNTTARMNIFFMIITISSLTIMMGVNIWQNWMSDLIPRSIWGSYFGIRTMFQSVFVVVGTFLFSKILDYFQSLNLIEDSYIILFSSASISALIALSFLIKVHEPPWTPHKLHTLKEIVLLPLKNKNYRSVLIFLAIWSFSIGIPQPFFPAHMLINLKMSYSQIAIYSIIITMVSLFSYPFWGKILDLTNAKSVLKLSIFFVGALPLFWLFATPHFLWPLWIDAFLTGIFWSSINLALFNLVLRTSPKDDRSIYLALQSVATGIFTFLGSILGGWMAQTLKTFIFDFFGQIFVNFHYLFLISSFGRWFSIYLLNRISDRNNRNVKHVLFFSMGIIKKFFLFVF